MLLVRVATHEYQGQEIWASQSNLDSVSQLSCLIPLPFPSCPRPLLSSFLRCLAALDVILRSVVPCRWSTAFLESDTAALCIYHTLRSSTGHPVRFRVGGGAFARLDLLELEKGPRGGGHLDAEGNVFPKHHGYALVDARERRGEALRPSSPGWVGDIYMSAETTTDADLSELDLLRVRPIPDVLLGGDEYLEHVPSDEAEVIGQPFRIAVEMKVHNLPIVIRGHACYEFGGRIV
mmetsp:Transcript_31135/g.68966  ORF Transcript_31135/g.68966 Transcript_31135/m.68966 type:complete len:235 (-) Transcript_31135:152-856(-)